MAIADGGFRKPGIHLLETAEQPRGVPAAAALGAMVGTAVRGRTNKMRLVASWSEFKLYFGGFPALPDAHKMGALAMFFHFENGGGPIYFSRITGAGAEGAVKADLKNHKLDAGAGDDALDVYANSAGKWGNNLSVESLRWSAINVAANVALAGGGAPPEAVVDIPSLVGVQIGDIIDVTNANGTDGGYAVVGNIIPSADAGATGKHDSRNLVALKNYLLLAAADKLEGNAIAAGSTIRSCSTHKTRTRLSAAPAAAATTLNLDSVAGLSIGSYICVLQVAMCDELSSRDAKVEGFARITAISGKAVTIAAELVDVAGVALNAIVTTDVKAFAEKIDGANDRTTFTAVPAGAAGNAVSYEVVVNAALGIGNETVEVIGNHVKFTVDNTSRHDGVGGVTLAALVATSAEATALLTPLFAEGGNAGGNDVISVQAKTFLTGGVHTSVVSQEFDIVVREDGAIVERHEGLSMAAESADYVQARLGGTVSPAAALASNDDNESVRIILQRDGDAATAGDNILMWPRAFPDTPLAGGVAEADPSDVASLGVSTQGSETGIYLFEGRRDIEYVCIPGKGSAKIAADGGSFAARNHTLFLMDTPQSDKTYDALVDFIVGEVGADDFHLMVFNPWLKVPDPRDSKKTIEVPPLAFVTSQFDLANTLVGAHGSAANKAALRGPIDLVTKYTDAQLGSINEDLKVNVIRREHGRGYRLMGDRTHYGGSDSRKFGAVRKWLNRFERSLPRILGDLLFSPGNKRSMRAAYRVVDGYLSSEFKRGALFPDDDVSLAYSVKCDEETTTAADLASGRLNIETRVSPSTPIEDIVVGIVSEAGGITITETVE